MRLVVKVSNPNSLDEEIIYPADLIWALYCTITCVNEYYEIFHVETASYEYFLFLYYHLTIL